MFMPSVFGRDMFDDFFGFPFGGASSVNTESLMKTDVKETDQGYELIMDMPGVSKENVKAELKNGCLTINATTSSDNEEKDSEGRYIRRERYYGSCKRSFYVGKEVTEEDIHARFENGTLKLSVPKREAKPAVETKRYIAIEG